MHPRANHVVPTNPRESTKIQIATESLQKGDCEDHVTGGDLSGEMEDFPQFRGDGAVVGVRGHDLLHVSPPFFADFGRCDPIPTLLILDLDIRKQVT